MVPDPDELHVYLLPGSNTRERRLIIRDAPVADVLELALLEDTPVSEMTEAEERSAPDVITRVMAEIALVDGVHGYRMDGIYPTVIVWDASRWNVVSDDIQTLFARLMGLERKDVHMHFLN